MTDSAAVNEVAIEEELLDQDGSRIIPKNANAEGKPREATKDCIDRHQECVNFRNNGECLKNPGWMIINCPRSCNDINNACLLRDPKLRCQRESLNMSTQPIYQPGDMDRMFQSIQQRFQDRYQITVHSTSPWVVTFENFVTDAEADALVKSIGRWERSTDTGSMNEFGESGRILSQGRTSSNGWCTHECEKVSSLSISLSISIYLSIYLIHSCHDLFVPSKIAP
jgi:hypothetical protein